MYNIFLEDLEIFQAGLRSKKGESGVRKYSKIRKKVLEEWGIKEIDQYNIDLILEEILKKMDKKVDKGC